MRRKPLWAVGASPRDHAVAGAVELAFEMAWDSTDDRELAVAAEAYCLLGFHDGAMHLSRQGVSMDEMLRRIQSARKGRPVRLLRADARGMLQAFYALAEAGVLNQGDGRDAIRLRWLARGGHQA